MSNKIVPFSLKDMPSLIEKLLPVQKLSAESYKEQMAVQSKTLTALGAYWKGRKPLILNKACVLGCLLPATDKPAKDLEIFEKLMAMDEDSYIYRMKRRYSPKEIVATISLPELREFFEVTPDDALPESSPIDWTNEDYDEVRIVWKEGVSEKKKREIEIRCVPKAPYIERISKVNRPEEAGDLVHSHVWDSVNDFLSTNADSFPSLVEQLGIMRFGHRPRFADTFCGSGQIPFEAARLGCGVYASDLNPVSCMLTWGGFHVIGSSLQSRQELEAQQRELVDRVCKEIDAIGIEVDGNEWRAKSFLYCVEVCCPQSGWMVPLLPTLIVSKGDSTIAVLVPNEAKRSFDIEIRSGVSEEEFAAAKDGTCAQKVEGKTHT